MPTVTNFKHDVATLQERRSRGVSFVGVCWLSVSIGCQWTGVMLEVNTTTYGAIQIQSSWQANA
eukprot:905173-Amphidinium_carterae.1